jgi:hypothetical protein
MFEEMNFEPGLITYNDFNINKDMPLVNQIGSLKEDLFQVEYGEDYLIDVGWYPSFNKKGDFRIRVIKNYDWTLPLLDKRCKAIIALNKLMEDCIKLVNEMI